MDHPFIQEAKENGYLLAAGTSGHTFKFFSLFNDLGGRTEDLKNLRLAAIAALVPHHHSLHEVLYAASSFFDVDDPYRKPDASTPTKLRDDLRAELEKVNAQAASVEDPAKT